MRESISYQGCILISLSRTGNTRNHRYLGQVAPLACVYAVTAAARLRIRRLEHARARSASERQHA
eukprot:6205529-Pleurochrysis_carterae.AAC.2